MKGSKKKKKKMVMMMTVVTTNEVYVCKYAFGSSLLETPYFSSFWFECNQGMQLRVKQWIQR